MRTTEETNLLRKEMVGSAMYHTSDPLELLAGEDIAVTYSLSGDTPTVTIAATLRVEKSYDPSTDVLSFLPYQIPPA